MEVRVVRKEFAKSIAKPTEIAAVAAMANDDVQRSPEGQFEHIEYAERTRQLERVAIKPIESPAISAGSEIDFNAASETKASAFGSRKTPISSGQLVADNSSRGELARVNLESELADAPSIGPKTAMRFQQIGITKIGQFLAADVQQMADQLNTSWIKPELLADWQAFEKC